MKTKQTEQALIACIAKFTEAENDSERVEIAEQIIELDGRWDVAELSQFELMNAAKQIIQEQIAAQAAKIDDPRNFRIRQVVPADTQEKGPSHLRPSRSS